MNDKSHVALMQCFYCMKDVGVLLHKRLAPVLPHRMCVDQEPCDDCAKLMEQGVILISVDEQKTDDLKNPWRTGGWVVVWDEFIERVFKPRELVEQVLRKRVAFLPDEVWCMIGLPGIKAVRDHECRACGAKWTAPIKMAETPNISGEATPWCPQCSKRASSSSSWRYVRDEGEPAAAALSKLDDEGKVS